MSIDNLHIVQALILTAIWITIIGVSIMMPLVVVDRIRKLLHPFHAEAMEQLRKLREITQESHAHTEEIAKRINGEEITNGEYRGRKTGSKDINLGQRAESSLGPNPSGTGQVYPATHDK